MGSSVKLRANLLLLRPLLSPKWPLKLLTAERRVALRSLSAELHACMRACASRKHLTGTQSRSGRDDKSENYTRSPRSCIERSEVRHHPSLYIQVVTC